MKISCQSTESLFLNSPPFSLPPPPSPFPEKIFYSHPYCQIRVSQSKGGGRVRTVAEEYLSLLLKPFSRCMEKVKLCPSSKN